MKYFSNLDESRIKLLLQLMAFVAILSTTLLTVFHPDVRAKVRSLVIDDSRKILSVASGDLFSNGTNIKVVKIKSDRKILVEVYGAPTDSSRRKLLHSITINDPHDGYFHFNESASNLVLEDIDNDRTIEIIAPSFDSDLVAHLNIYKFDTKLEKFVLYTPPSPHVSH